MTREARIKAYAEALNRKSFHAYYGAPEYDEKIEKMAKFSKLDEAEQEAALAIVGALDEVGESVDALTRSALHVASDFSHQMIGLRLPFDRAPNQINMVRKFFKSVADHLPGWMTVSLGSVAEIHQVYLEEKAKIPQEAQSSPPQNANQTPERPSEPAFEQSEEPANPTAPPGQPRILRPSRTGAGGGPVDQPSNAA
jgi:hypothetical protein